jgi:hypothetical protein
MPMNPLCRCGNAARYVTSSGELTCALCPLRAGQDSIRLADVPHLLAWARRYALSGFGYYGALTELRAIIGKNVSA